MNRQTLRRLERKARARYYNPQSLERLHKRAHDARPNDNPDELDTRLRLALPTLTDAVAVS